MSSPDSDNETILMYKCKQCPGNLIFLTLSDLDDHKKSHLEQRDKERKEVAQNDDDLQQNKVSSTTNDKISSAIGSQKKDEDSGGPITRSKAKVASKKTYKLGPKPRKNTGG